MLLSWNLPDRAAAGKPLPRSGTFQRPANVPCCHDTQYNVIALTDASGIRLERVWYEPYGKQTVRRDSDGAEQATSFFDNPCLFQGQRYDAESGTYHFRNRQYSAVFGRFLQRDPIGYKDGMNLYFAYFAAMGLPGK